ncbi:hypothetical protein KKG31_05545 [Patescibacteria group bacterium]|nr:hypothetical protein [Patescibacteria group bacterium]MBU1758572.1 hypothetical protein [Patescibacteria group bacterium]
MAKIEVSEDIVKSFELLRTELDTIYAPKKLSNDEIMGAMIGGFFDSLTHLHQH